MPDITIGRLRGGYCVYWREGGNRRRYQLAARTRAEAESEARDRYLKETGERKGRTVAAIWEAYVDSLGEKPSAQNVHYLGVPVLAVFGAFRPDQITPEDCRGYTRKRQAENMSASTIHTELGYLRTALRWARKVGWIERVPHIVVPPKPDSKVQPLSDEQIAALLDGCAAPHVRLAIVMLLATGARVSAVLDLTWDRVDLQRGVIDLRLPDGVTRKGRAVLPINRMARAALESARQAALTPYVVEWGGKRVKSIRKGYSAALGRAGMEGLRIHQIRHTVAVRMISAGRPIEEVAQYLGHSNTAITYRTYARFMPEHLADAAALLEFGELRSTS